MTQDAVSTFPKGAEVFGWPPSGLRIVRRREMAVRVVRTAVRRRQQPAVDPEAVAEAKRRFAVCKGCEHSLDEGFGCELYEGCCFGRWRAQIHNRCPARRW